MCKLTFFSDNLFDLCDHVTDHALNWLKEIWSFKLQDLNVLGNTRLIFQDLIFTLAYVVLNGDSENVLFFRHYFLFFCLVPVPLQLIYVAIETQ